MAGATTVIDIRGRNYASIIWDSFDSLTFSTGDLLGSSEDTSERNASISSQGFSRNLQRKMKRKAAL